MPYFWTCPSSELLLRRGQWLACRARRRSWLQHRRRVCCRTRAARRVEWRAAVFLLARDTGSVVVAVAELVCTATRVTRTLSRRRRIFFVVVVVAVPVAVPRITCLPLLLRELVTATTDAAALDATVLSALITPTCSSCCSLFQCVESTILTA